MSPYDCGGGGGGGSFVFVDWINPILAIENNNPTETKKKTKKKLTNFN